MVNKVSAAKERLQAIVRRLNPNVPAGTDDGMPRIDRDVTAVRQLSSLVSADPKATVLLTGHIGVGKSTELAHLARRFESERVVIRCSAVESLGIQNVDAFSLLVVVIEATIGTWIDKVGNFPTGLLDELVDHVRRIVPSRKQPVDPRSPRSQLQEALERFQGNRRKRIETPEQLQSFYADCIRRLALRYVPDKENLDPSEMVASCEILIKEIAHTARKPVLLVIDDLDKMRNVDAQSSIFIDQAMAWTRLPCGLVATLPYDALFAPRGPELDNVWGEVLVLDPLPLPSAAGEELGEPELQPYLMMLREAGAHTAISALQCRRLAIASSGIVRSFIHVCSSAVLYALQSGKHHVLDFHVDQVIGDLTNLWRSRLTDEDFRSLIQVIDSEGANISKAAGLLRDGVIIRNTGLPPESQVTIARWAQPLVEAYRRRRKADG